LHIYWSNVLPWRYLVAIPLRHACSLHAWSNSVSMVIILVVRGQTWLLNFLTCADNRDGSTDLVLAFIFKRNAAGMNISLVTVFHISYCNTLFHVVIIEDLIVSGPGNLGNIKKDR